MAQNKSIYLEIIDSSITLPIHNAACLVTFSHNQHTKYEVSSSNNKGLSQINLPVDASFPVTIKISHLSYVSKTITVGVDEGKSPIKVFLLPRDYIIEDIVIKDQGVNLFDTVRVALDSTQLIHSNNIIEQLEKDKRFTILPNAIFYNGKQISKVLVDNADLTGDNYMNLMEQAKIGSFASLDIIQNFHENPLNDGFENPEVALRLNMREKKPLRIALSGNADISQIRINEVKLNNYFLGNKFKIHTILHRNRKESSIYRPNNNFLSKEVFSPYPDYIPLAPVQSTLPNTNIRRVEGLSQFTFPIGKKINNRTSLFYGQKTNTQHNISHTLLRFDSTSIRYDSRDFYHYDKKQFLAENEMKFFHKNTFIQFSSLVNVPEKNFDFVQDVTGNINEVKGDFIKTKDAITYRGDLLVSQLISEGFLLEYNGLYQRITSHEIYDNVNQRGLYLYGVKGPYSDDYMLNKEVMDHGIKFKFKFKNKFSINPKIGFYLENSNQLLYRHASDSLESKLTNSINTHNQKVGYLFLPWGNLHENKRFRYEFQPRLSVVDYLIGDQDNYMFAEKDVFYHVNFKSLMKFRKWPDISWNSKIVKQIVQPEEIMPVGFHNTSFILFQGVQQAPIASYASSELMINKGNFFTPYKAQLSSEINYYFKDKSEIINRDGIVGTRTLAFFNGFNTQNKAKFEYEFSKIRLVLNYELQWSHVQRTFVLNNNQLTGMNNNWVNIAGVNWKTRHFTYIYTYFHVNQRYKISNNSSFDAFQKRHSVDVRYISSNRKLNALTSLNYLQVSSSDRDFIDWSVTSFYSFSKKLQIGVYGTNLLNNQSYDIVRNDDYGQSIFSFAIVPMQIGGIIKLDIF